MIIFIFVGKDKSSGDQHQPGISPASTLTDSLGEEDGDSNNNNNASNNNNNGEEEKRKISADSMASIISGILSAFPKK